MGVMRKVLLSVVVVALCAVGIPAQAQSTPTVITVGVPEFQRDLFNQTLLAEFEAANPDIKVKTVIVRGGFFIDTNQESRFENYEKLVSAADVIPINPFSLTPEGTQAGYFFDLAPLVAADSSLNPDDFHKAFWESYQWDRGIWAIPTSGSVVLLAYDPAAFDAAGLAYPNESWTLTDLADAIRKLAVTDESGKVTRSGINIFPGITDSALVRSLLESGLYDNTVVPNPPQLDRPDVEALVEVWAELQSEGYLNTTEGAPMSLTFGGVFALAAGGQQQYSLLPGGKAGLIVQGYAVSAGTQYPEAAYRLAKFLSTRAELSTAFGGNIPARKDVAGASVSVGGPGGGGPVGGPGGAQQVPQELIDRAIANALPVSELRYTSALSEAARAVAVDKVSVKDALQQAEQTALQEQQEAIARKASTQVIVATPEPEVKLEAGQIALNFAISSNFRSPTDTEDWQRLIREFVANDPQVKQINLETEPATLAVLADKYDCFYMSYNDVPSAPLNALLNLDPFFSADTTFDKEDFVGGVLAQVERDNKVWGLPVVIEPAALMYNSELFAQLGLTAPESKWTISQFTDALKVLRDAIEADRYPFAANAPGGSHLLSLIAAYGGLPIDYRTNPPTINFTDPATVEAIRQVLDLAKAKLIEYNALGQAAGGIVRMVIGDTAPIYTALLNTLALRRPQQEGSADPYRLTAYPRGTGYNLFSYSIGTAYISAKAQNPDACYRWISEVARHPELFGAMPARRSMITNSASATAAGAEATAFYNTVDELLRDPNTISMPTLFGSGTPTSQFLQIWLFRAFDKYVLEDGDLETLLREAEGYTRAYQECVSAVPSFDLATQQFDQYIAQIRACLTKVDSSFGQ